MEAGMKRRKRLRCRNDSRADSTELSKKSRDEREESPDLPLIAIKQEREARSRELRVSLQRLNIIFCTKCYEVFTTLLALYLHQNVCGQKILVKAQIITSDDEESSPVTQSKPQDQVTVFDDECTLEEQQGSSEDKVIVSAEACDKKQEVMILSDGYSSSQKKQEEPPPVDNTVNDNATNINQGYFEDSDDSSSNIKDGLYFSEMCPFCGVMDTSMEHLATNHAQNMLKRCWICLTWFQRISASVHMSKVHKLPTGAWHCQICGKLCQNGTVEQHIASQHKNMKKAYQCIDCNQIFRNESALQCHHKLQHITWCENETLSLQTINTMQSELKIIDVFSLKQPPKMSPLLKPATAPTLLTGQSGKLYDQLRQMPVLPLGQRYVLVQTQPGVLAVNIVTNDISGTESAVQQAVLPNPDDPTLSNVMPIITQVVSGAIAERNFADGKERRPYNENNKQVAMTSAIPSQAMASPEGRSEQFHQATKRTLLFPKIAPKTVKNTQGYVPIIRNSVPIPVKIAPKLTNQPGLLVYNNNLVLVNPVTMATTFTNTPEPSVPKNPPIPFTKLDQDNSNLIGSEPIVNHAIKQNSVADSLTSELLIKSDPEEPCKPSLAIPNEHFFSLSGITLPISYEPLPDSPPSDIYTAVKPICSLSPRSVSNESASSTPKSSTPIYVNQNLHKTYPVSAASRPSSVYLSKSSPLAVSSSITPNACQSSNANSLIEPVTNAVVSTSSSLPIAKGLLAPMSNASNSNSNSCVVNTTFVRRPPMRRKPKQQPPMQASDACPMCGVNDTSKEHFLAKHIGDVLYLTCRICFTPFGRKSMLYNHMVNAHTFPGCRKFCQICSQEFRERELKANALAEHTEAAHGALSTRVHCVVCRTTLMNEFAMSYHLMLAHGQGSTHQERCVCMLCESSFTYSMYLHDHMLAKHADIGVTTASQVNDSEAVADIMRRRRILPMVMPSAGSKQPTRLCHNIPMNSVTFPILSPSEGVKVTPQKTAYPVELQIDKWSSPGTDANEVSAFPVMDGDEVCSLPDTDRSEVYSLPGSDGNEVCSSPATDVSEVYSLLGSDGNEVCPSPGIDGTEVYSLPGSDGNEVCSSPGIDGNEVYSLPGSDGNEVHSLPGIDGNEICSSPGTDSFAERPLDRPKDKRLLTGMHECVILDNERGSLPPDEDEVISLDGTDTSSDSRDSSDSSDESSSSALEGSEVSSLPDADDEKEQNGSSEKNDNYVCLLPAQDCSEECILPGEDEAEESETPLMDGSEKRVLPGTDGGDECSSSPSEQCLSAPESPVGSEECILPDLEDAGGAESGECKVKVS